MLFGLLNTDICGRCWGTLPQKSSSSRSEAVKAEVISCRTSWDLYSAEEVRNLELDGVLSEADEGRERIDALDLDDKRPLWSITWHNATPVHTSDTIRSHKKAISTCLIWFTLLDNLTGLLNNDFTIRLD